MDYDSLFRAYHLILSLYVYVCAIRNTLLLGYLWNILHYIIQNLQNAFWKLSLVHNIALVHKNYSQQFLFYRITIMTFYVQNCNIFDNFSNEFCHCNSITYSDYSSDNNISITLELYNSNNILIIYFILIYIN